MVAVLVVVATMYACAHAAPVLPQPGPVHYALPRSLRDSDYLCTIEGAQGYCVRVDEVRRFLLTLRASP